jgi:UrcA family protein
MLLACALAASTAFADDQVVRTETVHFQDLDVDTPAGVNALYGRIQAAAERVCFQPNARLELLEAACERKAEAQAVEKLNVPLLTAYYRVKTGRPTHTLSANR